METGQRARVHARLIPYRLASSPGSGSRCSAAASTIGLYRAGTNCRRVADVFGDRRRRRARDDSLHVFLDSARQR